MSKALVTKLAADAGIRIGTDVIVKDERFYDRVFRDGSLGLGESYMEGWLDTANKSIDELIELIIRANIKEKLFALSWGNQARITMWWLYNYMFPVKTIEHSKVVGAYHYDLGNELFEEMLEDTMMYSCAYFKSDSDTLTQAQMNKIDLIIQKLHLKPGMRVLDIGCGWGFLAHALAEKAGVYVDGITISQEQHAYAVNKYQSEKVKFYMKDYREFNIPNTPGWCLTGTDYHTYDAIVSVGMFEHVCANNYQEFMRICSGLLKPGGLFLLHTIGSNRTRTVEDRWITKYVFPNSCLPSLSQISTASEGLLVIEDVHNFGMMYDKTLMAWYNNFQKKWIVINERRMKNGKNPLDIPFFRLWKYYLLSCAGGFRARNCQLYQVVLSKDRFENYSRN